MTEPHPPLRRGTTRVEQIPVAWVAAERADPAAKLVLWLAPGVMGMEAVEPVLELLARAGYVAVSFDT